MKSDKPPKSEDKSPGKVFDVRRPGKAPASPTSRPVIMGHQKEAQDTQAAVSGVGDNSRPLLSHKRKLEIQAPAPDSAEKPRLQSVPQSAPAQKTELSVQTEEALATTALATTTEPPAEKPSEPEVPTPVPAASPPSSPEPIPEAAPQSSIPAETTPDQAAPLPKIEEPEIEFEDLIVVSHHHSKTSTWEVVVLIILLIILAAAVVDVLLDLAILDLPLPHTNFFED